MSRLCRPHYFNPRSPRGGATAPQRNKKISIFAFQSTLPTRGSDKCRATSQRSRSQFQSTLPTRGSDPFLRSARRQPCDFNPRSPRGGATIQCGGKSHTRDISIHAPHEGERRLDVYVRVASHLFQSTLPTRGSDSGKVHLYTAFPRIY